MDPRSVQKLKMKRVGQQTHSGVLPHMTARGRFRKWVEWAGVVRESHALGKPSQLIVFMLFMAALSPPDFEQWFYNLPSDMAEGQVSMASNYYVVLGVPPSPYSPLRGCVVVSLTSLTRLLEAAMCPLSPSALTASPYLCARHTCRHHTSSC